MSFSMGECTVGDRVVAEVVVTSIHVTTYVTFLCCAGVEEVELSDEGATIFVFL